MTVKPLVTGASDGPKDAWAGVWIVEDIQLIEQGIRNGSWIDGTLGVVGASLDALALVTDPAGALLQYGIAWLIEHVKPLSDALDWLAAVSPGRRPNTFSSRPPISDAKSVGCRHWCGSAH